MIILWTAVGIALLLSLVSSYLHLRQLKRGKPAPLSDAERELCARIVDRGMGHPWVCRAAVDSGDCPCLPCEKLEKAKRGELFRQGVK